MLEEAAPLTEPPQGGWLGEWLLSVWGYFWEALGTFRGTRGDCSRGDCLRGDRVRGTPQCRVLGF